MKAPTALVTVLLCVLLAQGAMLHAQTASAEQPEAAGTQQAEPEDEARERRTLDQLGIIFNTPSILLEIDQYQRAGIGLKAFWQELAGRALLGLHFESGRDVYSVTLGGAVEYHLLPGRVSPYLGGALTLGYLHDDWGPTTLTEFELSIGPIFGVEFMLTEGLSVFAEYSIRYAAAYAKSSGAGGDESGWNYFLGTELGNQGSLGIVVYFLDRRGRTSKLEEETDSADTES